MFQLKYIDKVWLEEIDALAYIEFLELNEEKLKLVFPFTNQAEELNHVVMGRGYEVVTDHYNDGLLTVKCKNQQPTSLKNYVPLKYNLKPKSLAAYCPSLDNLPLEEVAEITGKNQFKCLYETNQVIVSPNLYNKEIKISATIIYLRWVKETKDKCETILFNVLGEDFDGSTTLIEMQGTILVEPQVSLLVPTRTLWLFNLVEKSREIF